MARVDRVQRQSWGHETSGDAGHGEPTSSKEGPSINKCSQMRFAYESLGEAAVPIETLSEGGRALGHNALVDELRGSRE